MLDVQAVLRPWSSHAWRVALASTAVTLPLHVLPAGAVDVPDVPLASPPGGYGVMQLTDGIGFNAAGQSSGPRAWASAVVATATPIPPVTAMPISAGVTTAAPVPTAVV